MEAKYMAAQFGTSHSADFGENTWTVEMNPGYRVVAGPVAILSKAVYDELLEALRAIVETCDDPQGSESGESLACAMARLLPAARAAVAKATGAAA